jgi:hypothetical protein
LAEISSCPTRSTEGGVMASLDCCSVCWLMACSTRQSSPTDPPP